MFGYEEDKDEQSNKSQKSSTKKASNTSEMQTANYQTYRAPVFSLHLGPKPKPKKDEQKSGINDQTRQRSAGLSDHSSNQRFGFPSYTGSNWGNNGSNWGNNGSNWGNNGTDWSNGSNWANKNNASAWSNGSDCAN